MDGLTLHGRNKIALSVNRGCLVIKFGNNESQIKIIPISNILCVEVVGPQDNHRGYFYFRTPVGNKTIKPSVMGRDIKADDDIIYFENDESYETALKIQEYIADYYAQPQAASVADELRKFKTLLDDGIISQEEFDLKKKEMLGL